MWKESSLIPTLRSENLADISTECFSFHQGKSYEVDQRAQLKTWYWSSNEMLGGSGNKARAWVYRAFRACRGRTATCGVKQWAQSTCLQLRLASTWPSHVCMWHLRDSVWMHIYSLVGGWGWIAYLDSTIVYTMEPHPLTYSLGTIGKTSNC